MVLQGFDFIVSTASPGGGVIFWFALSTELVRVLGSCTSTFVHSDVEAGVVEAVDALHSEFRAVDNLVACNTTRVLKAFQNARVGSHHFGGSTGYGHDEAGGREALDQAFAEIVGAESAIVRSQFFSGTHAITCALFALLRPGDELLAVAGAPYDTLEEVIGKRDSGGLGSLPDFGVKYREVPLAEDGGLDWDALMIAVKPNTKCALIQRSCGYSWRQSLSVNDIGRAIKIIKMQNPSCSVMVDNCYGEFVESIEPPMVGADLIAGSLIKNPGGTIAPCGGYVAGRKNGSKQLEPVFLRQGLVWIVVQPPVISCEPFSKDYFFHLKWLGKQSSETLCILCKGSLLIAEVLASKGYKVQPLPRIPRCDTVQAVQLGSRERLLAFCEAVQRSSPVGSYTKPVAGTTPGYASEVIFADGTFIDGSTSELSCDGPLREPLLCILPGWHSLDSMGISPRRSLKSI
ncbi:Pyridoxal phosphate-dependent transferase, major domain [Sesbania bispinosa]|nr:Pyridoxal phosphate-dependent transferase, major domain [Sesbania bispinosa]